MKSPIEEIAHEMSSTYLTVTHRTNAGNLHFDVVIWEPIEVYGFIKFEKIARELSTSSQDRPWKYNKSPL